MCIRSFPVSPCIMCNLLDMASMRLLLRQAAVQVSCWSTH